MLRVEANMKIEIEFKTDSTNGSEKLSQKLSPILNAVQQQGLDAREFSIEMDIGSNGDSATQFAQKITSVFNSMNQQGLKAKEIELEISTGSSDIAPSMQKVSEVINSIKEQGFEVKELEVDAEKEE
jgi:flagellar hook-basal body complex protein FliE